MSSPSFQLQTRGWLGWSFEVKVLVMTALQPGPRVLTVALTVALTLTTGHTLAAL